MKTVQVIYAYYQNGGQNRKLADRELAQSLDSAYTLYVTLLYFPVFFAKMARRSVEKQKRMGAVRIPRKEELLADNRYFALLEENPQLSAFADSNSLEWLERSDFLKESYRMLLESEAMEEYCQNDHFDFQTDRDFWKKAYKALFQENDAFDALLEEQNIYWNGDKELIDSFVVKTIRALSPDAEGGQELQKEFKDEEDRKFALDLLHSALSYRDECQNLVAANCRRWDPSRLAFMDVLIMQVALAEMLDIPGIPVKVTINEYVELAKLLSTPASGSFVNGMLDTIARDLASQGRLNKEL
ncbi:MAG: transcription antitermination protein NusB [Bacteroidaceae bacterium]|nr:transcription antitermination protein NusB [Bacteroidaceae bacterium]